MSDHFLLDGVANETDYDGANVADDEEFDADTDRSANAYGWAFIPEPVMLTILRKLSHKDIVRSSECCQRWNDIAKDDFLWRQVFQRDFKVARDIALKPGEFVCIWINIYTIDNMGCLC